MLPIQEQQDLEPKATEVIVHVGPPNIPASQDNRAKSEDSCNIFSRSESDRSGLVLQDSERKYGKRLVTLIGSAFAPTLRKTLASLPA